MKRMSKFLIIGIWVVLIYALFKLDLATGNIDNLNAFFNKCGSFKALVFIILSSFRIAALIPSAVFMILGGVLFNPFEGILLTIVSVMLSETIVYAVSRVLVGCKLQSLVVNKYPRLYELLLKNNIKILALGILCPIAPSDVACFLVSSTGLSYKKFLLTVVLSNMPMMILYSFLGNSFLSSGSNTIMIAAMIILISIYSIYLWHKEQGVRRLA